MKKIITYHPGIHAAYFRKMNNGNLCAVFPNKHPRNIAERDICYSVYFENNEAGTVKTDFDYIMRHSVRASLPEVIGKIALACAAQGLTFLLVNSTPEGYAD